MNRTGVLYVIKPAPVYILEEHVDFEGTFTVAICATREAAEAVLEWLVAHGHVRTACEITETTPIQTVEEYVKSLRGT